MPHMPLRLLAPTGDTGELRCRAQPPTGAEEEEDDVVPPTAAAVEVGSAAGGVDGAAELLLTGAELERGGADVEEDAPPPGAAGRVVGVFVVVGFFGWVLLAPTDVDGCFTVAAGGVVEWCWAGPVAGWLGGAVRAGPGGPPGPARVRVDAPRGAPAARSTAGARRAGR